MTPKEQADLELVRAQRDEKYMDMGVVDPVIIAKELKQDKTYTNITDKIIEELEEYSYEPNPDTEEDKVEPEQEDETREEEDPETDSDT